MTAALPKDVEAGGTSGSTELVLAHNPGETKPNFFGRNVTDWSQGITALIVITAIFIAIFSFVNHQNVEGGCSTGIAIGGIVNFVREGQMGRWKSLTRQNQQLQKNVDDLSGQISTLKGTEKALNLSVEQEAKANEKLLASEAQLKQTLAEKVADFDRVNASLKETQKQLEKLQPLLAKYKAQEAKLVQEEGALKQDITSLAAAAAQADKERKNVDQETQDLSGAAVKVHDANNSLATDLKVLEDLKAGVQALDNRVNQPMDPVIADRLKKAESRVTSLQSLLQTIISSLEQLSVKYPELKTLVAKFKTE